MTGIDYEKAFVAYVCWKQMQSETFRGMLFLAMMLRNRAQAGWFDGSIYRNAVSFMHEMALDPVPCPDAREPQFLNLLQSIDGIFSGEILDRTGGALYVAHRSVNDVIAGERTAELGQYIFFRSGAP
jgi:hypothetical protein